MKSVSGSLRLDLSQYRELEAFAAFGSDLDAASAAALGRGSRLVELLKQPQYSPFPVEEQVISIWLGTSGKLDDVPVADISKFESEFLDHVRRNSDGALAEIRDTGKLSDENVERLTGIVKDFKRSFTTSDGSSLSNEAPADAMDEDDVEQETVKARKKD
jgi:F-type H+-transporting ATPase subunit alpha